MWNVLNLKFGGVFGSLGSIAITDTVY